MTCFCLQDRAATNSANTASWPPTLPDFSVPKHAIRVHIAERVLVWEGERRLCPQVGNQCFDRLFLPSDYCRPMFGKICLPLRFRRRGLEEETATLPGRNLLAIVGARSVASLSSTSYRHVF